MFLFDYENEVCRARFGPMLWSDSPICCFCQNRFGILIRNATARQFQALTYARDVELKDSAASVQINLGGVRTITS